MTLLVVEQPLFGRGTIARGITPQRAAGCTPAQRARLALPDEPYLARGLAWLAEEQHHLLGLTDPDSVLDSAIAAVGERMKADTTRNRVTVYYLLASHFGRLEDFRPKNKGGKAVDEELPLAAAKQLLASLPSPTEPTDIGFYLQHCVKACEEGVERSHILPFAVDGALLLEVYVHDGIGTMVIDEKLEELREATSDDVGGILQLIEPFEKDGTLVKRDRTEIERDIDHYTIIDHDGVIFACAALYPYPEAKTAEMAALTVSPQSQGQGDGEKVLKRIEQRARAMGLKSIFVLTTRTMHWFIKRGFVQVDPDWLPEARKRKYNWDRKSQVLVKKL